MEVRSDVRVTIRVDRELKEQAENLFDRLGMNMSTALNVFLRKAVEESAIPFHVSTNSASIGARYSSVDITEAFITAVQSEIDDKDAKGLPIARYDKVSKQAYLEFTDGTRAFTNG